MVQIFCDICGCSKKFQSGIDGDYRLWFTSIKLEQVGDDENQLPMRNAVDICLDCRNALSGKDKSGPYDRVDDCLIREVRGSLERLKVKILLGQQRS